MTEAEWLAATDPRAMLAFVRGKASNRKFRLFACARLRIRHPAATPMATALDLEIATFVERLADGLADDEALEALIRQRQEAKRSFVERQDFEGAAHNRDRTDLLEWCRRSTSGLRLQAGLEDPPLFRCIFGNIFRRSSLSASVLDWHDGLVRHLAQAAYDHRDLPGGTLDPERLAVLADALEDAGCEDAALLGHLRSEGLHTRGCWAVDLLLGKE